MLILPTSAIRVGGSLSFPFVPRVELGPARPQAVPQPAGSPWRAAVGEAPSWRPGVEAEPISSTTALFPSHLLRQSPLPLPPPPAAPRSGHGGTPRGRGVVTKAEEGCGPHAAGRRCALARAYRRGCPQASSWDGSGPHGRAAWLHQPPPSSPS